ARCGPDGYRRVAGRTHGGQGGRCRSQGGRRRDQVDVGGGAGAAAGAASRGTVDSPEWNFRPLGIRPPCLSCTGRPSGSALSASTSASAACPRGASRSASGRGIRARRSSAWTCPARSPGVPTRRLLRGARGALGGDLKGDQIRVDRVAVTARLWVWV